MCLLLSLAGVTAAAEHHDYENQYVLQINREPARASFFPFCSEPGDRTMTLDGEWKFNWTKTPGEQPADFYLSDFDDSRWNAFPVPGDWEVNGYGTPIYSSSGYTFKIDPPYVMGTPKETYTTFTERNPTGCYRRAFTLPAEWQSKEVFIRFGAVSGAFYLWVNGERVGYSQGSMEPAEFRLTPYLTDGVNTIALEVLKYSDGSYLEDADTWRLAGIHRSVTLFATEQIRIRDFGVRTELDENYDNATLIIDPQLTVTGNERGTGYKICARLYDADGNEVLDSMLSQEVEPVLNLNHKGSIMNARYPQRGYAKWGWLTAEVKSPKKWSAETPYLYTLRLLLTDADGKTVEQVETKVGFRSIEISDGMLLINGRQVRLRGTNRTEFDPVNGRVISKELMEQDIRLLKQCNINAVRTSHYPNDPYWYELCDEYGMYVMDEADLEEHGLRGILASEPTWAAAFMDRAQRVVIRDRNHPSVIMWSLGNESGYGPNFAAMSAWIKQYDPTRYIHYEGAQGTNGDDPSTVDVTARFYPRTMDEYHNPGVKDDDMERPENARWERLLSLARAEGRDRPVVASEYAHAMGNAMGNMKEYWDEIYSCPKMLGGFIWTWVDEGIFKTLDDGRIMTAYGGDFGDKPNLKAFCLNGVIMADRTLTPKYYVVKEIYSPFEIEYEDGLIRIETRDEHADLSEYRCLWNVTVNGIKKKEGEAQARTTVTLPTIKHPADADVRLNVSLVLSEDKLWAEAGHEVATAQFAVNDCLSTAFRDVAPVRLEGKKYGKEPLSTDEAKAWIDMVKPHIIRAATDNDKGFGNWLAKEWTSHKLDSPVVNVVKPASAVTDADGSVAVSVVYEYALSEGAIEVAYNYVMNQDRTVNLEATLTPKGTMPTLPCLGITLTLPAEEGNLSWYGRGPIDSYPDRKEASPIGLWSSTVAEQYVHYARPQHSGSHEDTSWIALTDSDGHGWSIHSTGEPVSFTALPYSYEQLVGTAHDCDLVPEQNVYLHIDAATLGLGNSSCGPGVLKKYTIKNEPHTLNLVFRPL